MIYNAKLLKKAFNSFWKKDPQKALEDHTVWTDFQQFISSNPLEKETNDEHVVCYNHDSIRRNLAFLFSEQKEIEASQFKLEFLNPWYFLWWWQKNPSLIIDSRLVE